MADFSNTTKKNYNNNNKNRTSSYNNNNKNRTSSYNNNNNNKNNYNKTFNKSYNNNNKKDFDDDDKKFFGDTSFKKNTYNKKPVQRSQQRRPKGIATPEHMSNLIEYKLSAEIAKQILKADRSNRTDQEKLCDYVNSQCGLMGYCVRVSLF